MGAAMSAVTAAALWIFDLWQLWGQAKTALPIVLAFFFLFVLLGIREVYQEKEGSDFSIEPFWLESQQSIWHHAVKEGENYFDLQTALKLRFNNGDNVPRVVKTAELVLLRPRQFWKPKEIVRSYFVTFILKEPHAEIIERFDSSGPGITIAPHSMSRCMYFSFATELPLGVSSLENHLARVRFDILGHKEKLVDMPVHCQRPHEYMHYDSEARPLISDMSGTPSEPSG